MAFVVDEIAISRSCLCGLKFIFFLHVRLIDYVYIAFGHGIVGLQAVKESFFI